MKEMSEKNGNMSLTSVQILFITLVAFGNDLKKNRPFLQGEHIPLRKGNRQCHLIISRMLNIVKYN